MNIVKNTPVGIYEKALPETMSWMEKLNLAAECGYDFLEISIDESESKLERLHWNRYQKSELLQGILATGIPILSMCLSGHRKYPMGSESNSTRQRSLDIMEKAIQFSVDLGIRVIQLAGYDVYYEAGNEKTKELYCESMRQSVELASKANVILAIENMDHPFMNSISKVMEYIDLYQSPMLQAYPDIGNLTAWDLSIKEELCKGGGHIVGIHIKDTVNQVFRRIDFGEGIVDFSKAFQVLYELHYQGPFVIEMWSENNVDSKEKMIYARQWVQEKMKHAGYIFT
ncbi:L-ribulose-5-phosphate 3-epimerase [Pelosinus propionicus]|uniref:L-ribulose-5-phosphate 3-epimerase n=1 Tax=Pelosinus propionicus DSM 13327 TaxID=1123291 RepID=A0A1I4HYJ4_9FIRM|nr:L-ribulose-5-phosphate 3-epimerase [Pelosinus propionicus]SFL46701.1 L-xylulose 5-phosphate 3-epimerase [Pelosinus propionicus DSM 13327]